MPSVGVYSGALTQADILAGINDPSMSLFVPSLYRQEAINQDTSGQRGLMEQLGRDRLAAAEEATRMAGDQARSAERRLLMNAGGPTLLKALTGANIQTGFGDEKLLMAKARERAEQMRANLELKKPELSTAVALQVEALRERERVDNAREEQRVALANNQGENLVGAQVASGMNDLTSTRMTVDGQLGQRELAKEARVLGLQDRERGIGGSAGTTRAAPQQRQQRPAPRL